MLLEFTVENFRSIKEPVTLSAIAQSRGSKESANKSRSRTKSEDEIAFPYEVPERGLKVLPVLAIFGANASGKTNVIQALDYLLSLMLYGNHFSGLVTRNKLTPFKLSSDTIDRPTRFEISLLFDGDIYTYSLAITSRRITEEKLDYSPLRTKRNRILFHRHWDSLVNKYKWKNGDNFTGVHVKLQPNLQQEELFITLITRRLKLEITRSLGDWLDARVPDVNLEETGRFYNTIITINQLSEYMDKNAKLSSAIFELVKKFDTGIDEIQIAKASDEESYAMYALHRNNEGRMIKWLFEEESLGTQRLMVLALKMLTSMLSPIGGLTIVDEISANIHPNISREIIKMFQNPKSNPNHAQLIFTSHDNTLQHNLLRRDQIWFTEKRPDHSTVLYPLTDFKVRNDLAIDKAYLDGRFGAVPILPTDDELTLANGSK